MNLFRKTHKNRCVSIRDTIHAFFTEVYATSKFLLDAPDAYQLLFEKLESVTDEANIHNRKFSNKVGSPKFILLHLTPFHNWEKMIAGDGSLYLTTTTNQYLLVGQNGSIEIHQFKGRVYLKENPLEYRENKHQTLVFSKPGSDGNNVWGMPSEPIEFFSENKKSGLVPTTSNSPQL